MASRRGDESVSVVPGRERSLAGRLRLVCVSMLAVVWLAGLGPAQCQEAEIPVLADAPLATKAVAKSDTVGMKVIVVATKTPPVRQPVESEIAVTGMIPDGDYRLWSATDRCRVWTVGVEYDRHSWGHFLSAQLDYVAEVLPVTLLNEPVVSDFWGNAKSPNQQWVPGLSISPIGARMLWRSNRSIRPYMIGKVGTAVFTKKAFSPAASYANFNIQAGFGLLIRMTDRVDLRVDPLLFFHISNGYLAASNPGMDELGTKIGISYHLGRLVQETR